MGDFRERALGEDYELVYSDMVISFAIRETAIELMNHYCILKHDSRDNSDIIYRFAEIEFYLYDIKEQDKDISTYSRDCKRVEWFFHGSGVDIAFETVRDGDELMRFGGVLIRGIEIYKQNQQEQWEQIGVVIAIPDTFKKDRSIGDATKRIGIKDDLHQRFVFDDVDWDMPTERIVETKEKKGTEEKYHVILKKTTRKYTPKL